MTEHFKCHICGAQETQLISDYSALRRVTSDCKPWPAGGTLVFCSKCGAVQNPITPTWQMEIEKIYAEYTIYHQSGGKEQAIFTVNAEMGVSRSQVLLDKLDAHTMLPETGRMLDVGCGNGSTLRAFNKKRPIWTLAGTEFNDSTKKIVEQIPGVEALYTSSLDEIPGTFNLVTMVHVLEHIPFPQEFLGTVWNKLEADGLLVIEVPNHAQNPFDLLIADHCSHFTLESLTELARRTGFTILSGSDNWIPKELSVVARKSSQSSQDKLISQYGVGALADKITWLHSVIETAQHYANYKPFGLFGTSIAATWLFGELGNRVDFFVDEDPNRIGKTYKERPIYQPQDVPPNSHVFIPMPTPVARSVQKRMKRLNYGFSCYIPGE